MSRALLAACCVAFTATPLSVTGGCAPRIPSPSTTTIPGPPSVTTPASAIVDSDAPARDDPSWEGWGRGRGRRQRVMGRAAAGHDPFDFSPDESHTNADDDPFGSGRSSSWGGPDAPAEPAGAEPDPFDYQARKPTARDTARAEPAGQPPTPGAAHRLASGEEAIERALEKTTSLEFVETPLRDVVDEFRRRFRVNVLIDIRALDDVGIGTDVPITASMPDVKAGTALSLLLHELQLTWTIHRGVLLITTPEEAETMLVTRVYDVADLVVCRDQHGQLWDDYDTLIEVITTLRPDSWEEVGGPGSIVGATLGRSRVLVVSHTYWWQRQVAALLEQIRSVADLSGPDQQPPQRDRFPQGGWQFGGFGGSGVPAGGGPDRGDAGGMF